MRAGIFRKLGPDPTRNHFSDYKVVKGGGTIMQKIRGDVVRARVQSSSVALLTLSVTSGSASAYDCTQATYDRAYAEMDLAFKNRTLENDKQHRGDVLIDERFWRSLTINEKQSFVVRLVCALAGVGKTLRSYTLRSNMTGSPVGEYCWGKLTVPASAGPTPACGWLPN
jgi:hypothetical protein